MCLPRSSTSSRRALFGFVIACAASLALPRGAFAQSAEDAYPRKAVQIVIGFTAGGRADVSASMLAQRWGERLLSYSIGKYQDRARKATL